MQPFNPYAPAALQPFAQPSEALLRVPRPPRDASPAARKLVLGFGPGGVGLLLVGLVFSVIGLSAASALCGAMPGDVALALAASRTDGVVASVTTVSNMSVNGVHPREFTFDYRVGGVAHRATSSALDPPSSYRERATVPVEYLAFAPGVARVADTSRVAGGFVNALVLLFPLLGLTLVVVPIRGAMRRRRAFVHGTATMGTVVFFGLDRSTKVNGRRPTKLAWVFSDSEGRSFKGSVSAMEPALFGERTEGGAVVVLFDPANPKVNTLWVE